MAATRVPVTNIGTCRIAEPLGAASRGKHVRRRTENIYGFVHTTKEALQQIRYREDSLSLPEELAPYIAAKGVFPPRQELVGCDIFFVEISSVKEICFGDYLLQINYLDNAFAGRDALLKTFFKHRRHSELDARKNALEMLPEFETVTPLERRILLEGYVHLTEFGELQADMEEIVRRLPAPVVFVNHINVPDDSGVPIASRAELCTWMAEIARTHKYTLFDPTPNVLAFGREKALELGGRDTNHYTSEFKEALGAILVERFCKPPTRRTISKAAKWVAGLASGQAPAHSPPSEHPIAEIQPSHVGASTSTLVQKISTALKIENFEEATGLADQLIASGADTPKALTAIAKVLTKTRRYNEAAPWWERAAIAMPDQLSPLVELARCYYKARNYDRAVDAADQVLALQPADTALLFMKRDALMRLGRFTELATVALDLVSCDPGAAHAMILSLINHGCAKEASRVVAVLRETGFKEAQDDDMQARIVKMLEKSAKAKLESGNPEEAAADWYAILVIDPDHSHAASRLGKLTGAAVTAAKEHLAGGDVSAAIEAFKTALVYQPSEWKAVRSLAKCYEQQDMLAESAIEWGKLGQLRHDPVISFRRAAWLSAKAGDPASALKWFAKVDPAELDDDNMVTIGSLTRKVVKAMRQQVADGNLEEASSSAEAVLAIHSDHPEALGALRSMLVSYRNQSIAAPDSGAKVSAWSRVRRINAALLLAERRAPAPSNCEVSPLESPPSSHALQPAPELSRETCAPRVQRAAAA